VSPPRYNFATVTIRCSTFDNNHDNESAYRPWGDGIFAHKIYSLNS